MKKVISGVLAVTLLLGSTTVMAASSGLLGQKVQGLFSVEQNGTKIADAVVINGSTYVPVRAIAEATGTSIKVEGKKIIIGDTSSTAPSKNTNTGNNNTSGNNSSTSNSRANPASVGTTLPFTVKDILSDYGGTLNIQEVIRGEQAWQMIHEANMFNDEPAAGYEYMLAKAKVTITRNAKADTAVDLWNGDFTLVSTSGTAYDNQSVVTPDPKIDASIYAGSSNEGWVVFMVKKNDESPLIAFERKYDGSGGVWFKTK